MPGPSYHGRTHLPGGTDPIPGLTTDILAGGAALPYPREMPHGAVVTYLQETRKWPGGVIAIPPEPYRNVGATTLGAGGSGTFSNKTVSTGQTAASFAAAADTLSIPVATAGIPLGQLFWMFVISNATGTATSPVIKISPKPAGAHASDTGYGSVIPKVKTYFGCRRADYTTSIGATGPWAVSFAAGDTITVKAYAASGVGSIVIDTIILIPAGNQPGVGAAATYEGSFNFDRGPSCENGTDDSVSTYSGTSILVERQVRGGADDPHLHFTVKGDEVDAAYTSPQNSTYAWEFWHPRHKYVIARLGGASSSGWEETNRGFIQNMSGGIRDGHGAISAYDWGLIYLGLVPGARVWGEQAMKAWLASYSDGEYSWGEYTDEGLNSLEIAWTLYPSSLYDWTGYDGAAEFAHL